MVRGVATPCYLTATDAGMADFCRTAFPPAAVTALAAAYGPALPAGGSSTAAADAEREEKGVQALAAAGDAAVLAALAAEDAQAAAAAATAGGGRAAAGIASQAAGVASNARAHAATAAAAAAAVVLEGRPGHSAPAVTFVEEVTPGHTPARPRRRRRKSGAAAAGEPDAKRPAVPSGEAGAYGAAGPSRPNGGGGGVPVGLPLPPLPYRSASPAGCAGGAAAAAVAGAAAIVAINDAPLSPPARTRMMKELQELGVSTPLASVILDADLTAPLPQLPPHVDRPSVLKVRTKQRNRKSAERSRAKTKHKTTVAKDAAAEVWRECQGVWEQAMRLETNNRLLQAAVEHARGSHASWTEVEKVLEAAGALDETDEEEDPGYTFALGTLLEGLE